jgi:(2R)-3-sulfolactate dehydrogenase (NADP+)
MSTVNLSLHSLQALTEAILVAHDTSATNAEQVAAALVAAESDGQQGHGASRIPSYAAQAKSGKVDGHATPILKRAGAAALTIDAVNGFAYPALNLAFDALCELAPKCGIAAAAITRSHHSGVAGHQVERLADRGLIALCFCNTPQGIAPWGGNRGVFGTNPVAFAAPRPGSPPLVIDMSLSKVARGKINVAAQRSESIPEGWAVDCDGAPTTDPNAAMQGTLLPMGDAKGAQLVLMVEVLAAALTASNFGYEASSFFTGMGDPPGVGQFMIAIDPQPFSNGAFADRLEALLAAMLDQPGTRLPGAQRFIRRDAAERDGVNIPQTLYDELVAMRDPM